VAPRKQTKRRKKQGRKCTARIYQIESAFTKISSHKSKRVWSLGGGDTVDGLGHKDGIHTEVESVELIKAKKVKAVDSQSALMLNYNLSIYLKNQKINYFRIMVKNPNFGIEG